MSPVGFVIGVLLGVCILMLMRLMHREKESRITAEHTRVYAEQTLRILSEMESRRRLKLDERAKPRPPKEPLTALTAGAETLPTLP